MIDGLYKDFKKGIKNKDYLDVGLVPVLLIGLAIIESPFLLLGWIITKFHKR